MPGGKGCPMKKSKNKYSPWPAVALCLVFLALRIVDLALFTDPETSFPTVGPSAARWGAALVGAAALLVMGRRADEKIAPGRKSVLGVMMAVTGTVLVLAGLSQLLSATVVWPSMVLLTAAGVWFFAMGWRVLSAPEGRGTAMPPNAVQCLIPTAALLWVLIQRFSIIPAASARLGCTFRVLGALGALEQAHLAIRPQFSPKVNVAGVLHEVREAKGTRAENTSRCRQESPLISMR